MQVLILGTGDAFTTKRFGSSAVLRGPEGYALLDCPDPIHRVLHEGAAAAGWDVTALDIGHVLLTHLHGDHANGLESFGFAHAIARAEGRSEITPTVHTHHQTATRLWQKLAPAMDANPAGSHHRARLDTFFHMGAIQFGYPYTVCGLIIEAHKGAHPIPTCGYTITDPTTGKAMGWSGDTTFQRDHIDWLSSADLIVHECGVGAAHTHIEELNSLPDELRAKMRLIHTPDDFDPSSTDIAVLSEGEVIEL